MQACYLNTTHPDFLNGHKAMAIVSDRLNANKPSQSIPDPKSGRPAPGVLNNNKDLDVDPRKDDQSFFGSFFAKGGQTKKKGTTVMEAVRTVFFFYDPFSNWFGIAAFCDSSSGSVE